MTGRTIYGVVGLLFVMTVSAIAQLQVGNDLQMSLNGIAQFGYSAEYSDNAKSDHSMNVGAQGTLSGSYYSTNFLSFSATPFYRQSRANSNYQSITDATGVTSIANFFSAGYFPGSITYTKTYNGSGRYAVPGVADYTTHGNDDALGISWGLHVPDAPQVQFNLTKGHDAYSIYGSDAETNSNFRTVSLSSNYRLLGFNLNGNYRNTATDSSFPNVTLLTRNDAHSHGQSYGFGIGHSIPFHGVWNGSINHGTSESQSQYSRFNSDGNTINSSASFAPVRDLNMGVSAYYTDDLIGTLEEAIIESGGIVQNSNRQSSHGLDIAAYAGYTFQPLHLALMGNVDRRSQTYYGQSLSSTSYTGTASYGWYLGGGLLNITGSLVRTEQDTHDQSSTGANVSTSYTRKLGRWDLSGGFSYSQNTQTVLVSYMSNGVGFSGSVARKVGRRLRWSAGAYGSRNGLAKDASSTNTSKSFSTSISTNRVSVTGTYSQSDGNAILTAGGLSTVPVTGGVVTDSLVRYTGNGWSVGVGSTPMKGLSMSASFSKALSNTIYSSTTRNLNEQFNSMVQYRVRRIYFTGGYTRLQQGFSTSGSQPAIVSSYYIGLSRWFNFF